MEICIISSLFKASPQPLTSTLIKKYAIIAMKLDTLLRQLLILAIVKILCENNENLNQFTKTVLVYPLYKV